MRIDFARCVLAAVLVLLTVTGRAENGYQWSYEYPRISWFGHPQDAADAVAALFDTQTAPPAEPGGCSVPGAPIVLAEALCSGRSEELQGALDSLKDTDDPPTFLDLIPMLDRVWLGDRSLGTGLPWADLTGQYVRATIVQNLAEQVRLGRSKIPLKQMQEFAVQLSRKDAPLGASKGVVLIGFTHAPDQVEFLKQVLASSTQPGLRSAIIRTLGMLCDQEAGTLLVSLQIESRSNAQERKWIADALHWRSTLSERTCRMVRGGQGKR